MKDPYRDLPDDFVVPSFPDDVKLPEEMRAYWLDRIAANTELVEELERFLVLALRIRDRSILLARITTNASLREIGAVASMSGARVHQIEKEQRRKANDTKRD